MWVSYTRWLGVPSLLVSFTCRLSTSQSYLRGSQLGNCLDHIVLSACLSGILLIASWCKKTPPTVGSIVLKQISLHCIRWLTGSLWRKLVHTAPSWFFLQFLLELLIWFSSTIDCDREESKMKWNKPFLPQFAFDHGAYRSNRKQTWTPSHCLSPPTSPPLFVLLRKEAKIN